MTADWLETEPPVESINLLGTQGRIQSYQLSLDAKRFGPLDERENQASRRSVVSVLRRNIENVVRRNRDGAKTVPRYDTIKPPDYIITTLGYNATGFLGGGKRDLPVLEQILPIYRGIPDKAFQPHPLAKGDDLLEIVTPCVSQ